MSARLGVDREEHVAVLTLEEPFVTIETARTLVGFLDEVDADDDVKVVVVRAEGLDLSSGWDPYDAWDQYVRAPGGKVRKHPSQRARLIALDDSWWGPRGLYQRLLHCRKVTVVEARGDCLDTGLYLTLCSDLVVASPDARFGSPRWHNVGVDTDMSLLFATVGLKRAKELMYGNLLWSADRALEYGLVDQVVEDATVGARELASVCASIMRDGIVTEKYAVFASLEKMGIGHSFAATTVVAASLSNIHFQPEEYNFLRDLRDHGTDQALETSRRALRRD